MKKYIITLAAVAVLPVAAQSAETNNDRAEIRNDNREARGDRA